MRQRGLLLLMAAVALVFAGCGSSESVVTVTQTKTVSASSGSAESTATRSDQAWAELIRRQAKEVDDLSLKIGRGDASSSNAVIQVSNLEGELARAGLRGTSPCIQEVAAEWETTFGRFRDAFAMLVGAIPEAAQAASERFQQGPPVREEAKAVLSDLEECVKDLGGVEASASEGASGAGDGLTEAINTWVADAPAGEGQSSNDGLVWLLHTHGRLNTSGWMISETKTQGSITAVKIRAKKDVPVYIKGESDAA